MLRFEQTLVEDCAEIGEGLYEEWSGVGRARAACAAGAVIWRRDNWFGNYDTGIPPINGYYVIQVVDGKGKKIEPAWSEFVDAEILCDRDIAGASPTCTTNFFGALKGKGSINSGYCHCAYTGDLPYGLDNANPFLEEKSGKGLKRRNQRGLNVESPRETTDNEFLRDGGLADHVARRTAFFDDFCPDYTISPTETPSPTFSPINKKGKGKGN